MVSSYKDSSGDIIQSYSFLFIPITKSHLLSLKKNLYLRIFLMNNDFLLVIILSETAIEPSGKTLSVYLYMLLMRRPVGIREIQRGLNFSTPSLVHYHIK